MLSRAQEARVRDVLANHPPGIIQTYCLEHLAAAVKIPPGHLADLAAFVRSLREHGGCQTCYGGLCDADAHETDRVLIWGPPTPMAWRPSEPKGSGQCSMSATSSPAGETVAPLASALVRAGWARGGRRIAIPDGTTSGSMTPFMDRRAFIGTLSGGLLAAPLAVEAQQAGKVYRVGVLSVAPSRNPIDAVFETSMKNLGWVEGRNLVLQYRYTGSRPEQFVSAAEDFVRLNVDAIVVWSPAATAAVKNTTKTIPVVFLAGGAAVESGLVAGLPRPRENLTGITFQANRTLAPKYLEALKDLIPKLRSVAVLRVPAEDPPDETENYEVAARALGISLRQVELHRPEDLQSALADIERSRPQALVGAPSGLLYVLRKEITDFAAKLRLPAIYGLREVAEVGGLMSISPSIVDIATRGATYVDKILKGAKPADLPVEQPTKFELVINLKTAKALGLTIPPSLLQRADQVIE